MKLLAYFIAVAILIVVLFQPDGFSWRNLLSLNNPIAQKTTPSPVVVDTLEEKDEDLEIEVDSMVLLEQERRAKADSLLLSNTLDSVLLLAEANWNTAWSGQGRDTSNGAYNAVWWEARQGKLFSNKEIHLIIKRSGGVWDDTHLDIYKVHKDSFTHLLYHLQDDMTYINDTIKDVNGDKIPDFVIDWWPGSGCCPKAFNTIYLKTTKGFTEGYDFANAVFVPKQKAIYGMTYGQPGSAELYHYKWTADLQIDTVEHLVNTQDTTPAKYLILKGNSKTEIDSIPAKYNVLENDNYDWFSTTPEIRR